MNTRYTRLRCALPLLVGLLLIYSTNLRAQARGDMELLGGAMLYTGDLLDGRLPDPGQALPAFGLRLSRNIRPAWAIQGYYLHGQLAGSDADSDDPERINRDFSFQTTLDEGGLTLRWEPLAARRYPATGGFKSIVSPYLYLGAGLYRQTHETDYGPGTNESMTERIRQDRALPETQTKFTLPVGGGLRFDLGYRLSLGLEGGIRPAFSDQIDGVEQSGNPDEPDWYGFGLVTVGYRFHVPDADRDGIPDEADRCPKTPGDVNHQGCPDQDGDGVADPDDECPFQRGPSALAGCPDRDLDGVADLRDACKFLPGSLAANGCPDRDEDGLRDDDDLCPDCPGPAALAGCPDRDGDGTPDQSDRCPNRPGLPEFFGCPFPDQDGDGVADADDNCPTRAGRPEDNGCPDSDLDGLTDNLDRCPDLPGLIENNGCPSVPDTVQLVLGRAMRDVRFETAKTTLLPASTAILDSIVAVMQNFDFYHLRMSGHTDSRGSAPLNQRLSEGRARACRDYLVNAGIDAERLSFVGRGEEEPIATNMYAAGRIQNRRVEFLLYTPGTRADPTIPKQE